jgi:hypothetical protein
VTDRDRLLVARISGITQRHVRRREAHPGRDSRSSGRGSWRLQVTDRPDLLTEEAGILLGFYEGGLETPQARVAVGF